MSTEEMNIQELESQFSEQEALAFLLKKKALNKSTSVF